MKKLLYILALPSMLMLNSCGGEEATNDPNTNDENGNDSTVVETALDLKGLREFDMSPYELNAIIMIPEKYYRDEDNVEWFVEPTIKHNDGEALWEITLAGDKHWHMVIEDWGDDVRTTAIEKLEHEDQKIIFDFIYQEEGENYLLYSKVLKSDNTTISENEAKAMPNNHFYCVQNIAGSYVVFRSFEMGDFRGVTAKQMLTAARASKAK